MPSLVFRRRSLWRLASVLSDLLEEPVGEGDIDRRPGDGFHAILDTVRGRLFITLASAGGVAAVAATADAHPSVPDENGIPILAVPFMTPAGAEEARRRRVNWVDFAGNAVIEHERLTLAVDGRTSKIATRGRPAATFAPRSSRVARAMLNDPTRWWRQSDLARETRTGTSNVSRMIQRLTDERLVEHRGPLVRAQDPDQLLDAWVRVYRPGHRDGVVHTVPVDVSGAELRDLSDRLDGMAVDHAFTGRAAARLWGQRSEPYPVEVYLGREGASAVVVEAFGPGEPGDGPGIRLIEPADQGVFYARSAVGGLPCVSPVQLYLDLLRWPDEARRFRDGGLIWRTDSRPGVPTA